MRLVIERGRGREKATRISNENKRDEDERLEKNIRGPTKQHQLVESRLKKCEWPRCCNDRRIYKNKECLSEHQNTFTHQETKKLYTWRTKNAE